MLQLQRLHFVVPIILIAISGTPVFAAEPRTELLWPNGAPGAKGDSDHDKPSVAVYVTPADRATDAAMIVCPGGGYRHLAMGHEGKDIAQWLNSLGVTAIVLNYRHNGKGYQHPAPLNDVQRAIRFVRAHAAKWKLDPAKIGLMGFSAGGHLASSAGTHFDAGQPDAADPVDRVSCRPDFLILCYPVVTLGDKYVHAGSKKNLLGDHPDPALVQNLSNETQVTSETPPTFLFHTNADTAVPAENSVLFYLALRKANVPAELHIYQEGKHGVGLAPGDPVVGTWKERLVDWLKVRGLLDQGS